MPETTTSSSFLRGLTETEREIFDERLAICEFDGGLTHEEAGRMAEKCINERRKKRPQSAIEGHSEAGIAPDVKTYGNSPENATTTRYSGLRALEHMTNHGIKLIGAYERGAMICRAKVKGDYDATFTGDLAEIKALIVGLGDAAGRAQGKKIELFRFIPGLYDLLCLDIDRGHADGIDGLAQLYRFFDSIGKTKENLPLALRALPQSFPCYVTTPSGGFHLYFKYRGPKAWGLFAGVKGVEIKHMSPGLTAPGSRKPAGEYVLYGNLDDAPLLPAFIKNRLTIPKEERPPAYIAPGREKKQYGVASWEKIREWVDADGSYAGRNARAFAFAANARRHGWEKSDTLRALRVEPSVDGLPETEFITVVDSTYSKGSVKA